MGYREREKKIQTRKSLSALHTLRDVARARQRVNSRRHNDALDLPTRSARTDLEKRKEPAAALISAIQRYYVFRRDASSSTITFMLLSSSIYIYMYNNGVRFFVVSNSLQLERESIEFQIALSRAVHAKRLNRADLYFRDNLRARLYLLYYIHKRNRWRELLGIYFLYRART